MQTDTYFSITQKILSQRVVQTLGLLSFYIVFGEHLPLFWHRAFYSTSLFIKDLLLWMMPLTVGVFIAHTVKSFKRGAPLFLLTLLIFESTSNFLSVWYAYGSATLSGHIIPLAMIAPKAAPFDALWSLPFSRPSWWSADKGVFVGMALGLLSAFWHIASLEKSLGALSYFMQTVLTKGFARVIPLFVLGFAAQMTKTGLLSQVVETYTVLLLALVGFISLYLSVLFFLSAGGSPSKTLKHIKSLLPAGALALTSGCSLSTMPWTIAGASKNMYDPNLAKAVIPATTNIQQVGDAIANAFFCFLIYTHFFGKTPEPTLWLTFSVVFTLARFATAAMLGGAIFVMLPIYESYLHFNGEMIALVLALNVVFDPIVTSSNVMANGALCRVFERVWQLIKRERSLETQGAEV
ncbi:MAG: cation:dicarboxylate symporter family transporter [Alphaproteobacteria bacterium]|jgi:hypothetical protein|nr:dicarboxylate/amino acid:cation symporter [Alphaproteobacteria bacterium]